MSSPTIRAASTHRAATSGWTRSVASAALPPVKAGRLLAIAVTSTKRSQFVPQIPTIAETLPGYDVLNWYAIFAPAATPKDILSRLSRDLITALGTADLRERLTALGVDPWPGTSEELGQLLRADIQRYGTIARSAGLKKQ